MENSKEKKQIILKDARDEQRTIVLKKKPVEVNDVLKKAALYVLVAIAFIGCMFLIFGGDSESDEETTIFNDVIPQASGGEMQSDKQKAYEKELLQKKAEEKRQALITLSDYWQNDTAEKDNSNETEFSNLEDTNIEHKQDRVPTSAKGYQSIRNTLDNFYTPDDENQKLRDELNAFKEIEKENEALISNNPMQDQLELMEKSFQMAAKYLPQSVNENNKSDSVPIQKDDRLIQPVYAENKSVVSSLYRNPEHSNYNLNKDGNSFQSVVGASPKTNAFKNSISAVVHQTQMVRIGGSLKIRLTEPMRVEGIMIPKGNSLGHSQI